MGLENIRMNSSRCPPLLLGALTLLLLILTCSWWSLSTQNYDLLKQLDDITDQMRICFNDRDSCSISKNNLETRFKSAENEIGLLNVKLQTQQSSKDDAVKELHSKEDLLKTEITKKESLESDLKMCNTELESLKNLDNSKDETLKAVRNELREKKEEIKTLHGKMKELEKLKTNENETDKKQEVADNRPPIGETHEAQNNKDVEKAGADPNEDVQESPRFDVELAGGKDD